jgi:LPS export ABC transporter protein LptC
MFYFVKSEWFKLVLALGILLGLVGLLFFAQYTAKDEEKKYAAERKLHPMAEKITIDNYELKEVDDFNHMKWRLQAKTAILEPVTKDVILTMINVEYFDEGKVKMKVIAPKGVVNQDTHVVKLNCMPKINVVAEAEEGKSRLETKSLELTKKNQFIATGGVNINMSGVAKVSGDYATGVFGKSELQDVKIIGNTHSIVGTD